MSDKKEILDTILDTAKTVVESSKFQSFICGTYDDGTPRCFADSWNNVTYSPQQRKEKEEICERIKNDKIEPFSFTAEVKTKGKKTVKLGSTVTIETLDEHEIETCLNSLYGVMMLRLKKATISPDTEHAVKEISTLIGMLSDYYHKDKEEPLEF